MSEADEAAAAEDTAEQISLQVVLISGESLLAEVCLRPSDKFSRLRQLANESLRTDAANAKMKVTALTLEDGVCIDSSSEDAITIMESGLCNGSNVTAVVTELDELDEIETLFHGLIMKRNGCVGAPEKLTGKDFTFPSLREHVEVH